MLRKSRTALGRVVMLVIATIGNGTANGAPPAVIPLLNAHAHNDYLHDRPLFDALARGFASVEADVFLVDGKLLVAHERKSIKPERTLESLYLAPLAECVHQNGGHVFSTPCRFFLLIDIKDDPRQTYPKLQKVLAKYVNILTSVEGGKVQPGAVTVVLTGNRPQLDERDSSVRYVALDGRLTDLSGYAPAHLMPMVSDNWAKQFDWNGKGPMPEDERTRLREIAKKAHGGGRVVRFWATPENENVWRELRAAGVDLIGTDELGRLAAFLREQDDKRK